MTERPYETTVPDDLTSGTTSVPTVSTGGNSTTSPGSTAGSQGVSSTASAVGDEAKSVASDAADSGRQVAQTAASGAKDVVSEATTQLRQLFDQARSEFDGQASSQSQRAVGGLRSLADELRQMASGSEQQGLAGGAAKQAADRASSFADWLDNRQPGEILDEVRSLARRRPGAFLLGAAAVGLLGGRMTRGLTGGASGQQSTGGSVPGASTGAQGFSTTSPTGTYATGTAPAGVAPDISPVRSEPYTVGVRDTDTHAVTTATGGLTGETPTVYGEGESEARR